MKKFFIGLGIISLSCFVVVMTFLIITLTKGQILDKESKKYAEESIRKIMIPLSKK